MTWRPLVSAVGNCAWTLIARHDDKTTTRLVATSHVLLRTSPQQPPSTILLILVFCLPSPSSTCRQHDLSTCPRVMKPMQISRSLAQLRRPSKGGRKHTEAHSRRTVGVWIRRPDHGRVESSAQLMDGVNIVDHARVDASFVRRETQLCGWWAVGGDLWSCPATDRRRYCRRHKVPSYHTYRQLQHPQQQWCVQCRHVAAFMISLPLTIVQSFSLVCADHYSNPCWELRFASVAYVQPLKPFLYV